MKKIAFSGPSGLGKTTQCKYLESLGLKYLSTSAGDIFHLEDKVYMEKVWGYKGDGHKNVINLSSAQPNFGYFFQYTLLKRRGWQIRNSDNFVIDRCPIDNVAYMLTQVSHNASEVSISQFIKEAQEYYKNLTHVIMIQFSPDIEFIEDNNSRISNRFFQTYMSDVFRSVYTRYFANIIGPKVMTLDHWDLEARKFAVKEFIFPSQKCISYEEND
jgi:hypothetical protein